MRQLSLLLVLGLVLGCAPGEELAGEVLFLPGEQLDLELKPLARIERPVIIARGDERILTANGVFYEVERICGVLGCTDVVVQVEEDLCVSLRPPFERVGCTVSNVARFSEVEAAPDEVTTFVGRPFPELAPGRALTLGDELRYFGVSASGPISEEHAVPGDEDGVYNLELAGVELAGELTLDLAPGGVPFGGALVGWDDQGEPGAGLALRDGAFVELDQNAGILAGAAVGEAYFDTNGGRGIAFMRSGDQVLAVRASPTDQFELALSPPTPPLGLFFEALPANPGPSGPLRSFRAIRASAPTHDQVQVCFNQRLDDASSLELDFSPAAALEDPVLLEGDQCVSVRTEGQQVRAPLTLEVTAGESARGDPLTPGAVSAQSPALPLVDAFGRVFGFVPNNARTHGFVPLSDGGVLVSSEAEEHFELSPDLLTRRESGARLLPRGVIPLAQLPPDRTGAWILGGGAGVVFYDADTQVDYQTGLASTFELFPLEGERAIVRGERTVLLANGVATDIVPPDVINLVFQTPVHGADEVVWFDSNRGESHVAGYDGTPVTVVPFVDQRRSFDLVVMSGGQRIGFSNLGEVGVVDAAGFQILGDAPVVNAWTRLPSGAVEVYGVGGFAHPLIRIEDGARIEAPLQTDLFNNTLFVGQVRRAGDRVFARAMFDINDFEAHRALRVTHVDRWTELTEGAP